VYKRQGKYKFQVGSTATTITADVPNAATSGIYSDVAGAAVKIDNATDATAAIALVDLALGKANTARSKLGAAINQLTYAADNLSNISMNTAASRSRIEDTDYAQASTELARTQIVQQAATAMLAQANQSPQSVLALLK
jgi:flagellin